MRKRIRAHGSYDRDHCDSPIEFFCVFVKHFSEVVVLVVCKLRRAQLHVVLSPSALQFHREVGLDWDHHQTVSLAF